jgi:hypothetical protein
MEFCSAQTCLDSLLGSSLYSDPSDIVNGPKWIYHKKFAGSALLIPGYWPKADIDYNGFHYTDQVINFDLLSSEMVLYQSEVGKEKYVVLNKDLLSGFSFTDTVTSKRYVYLFMRLPGTPERMLYEDASTGNIPFFIRPVRLIESGSETESQSRIVESYEYYLKSDTVFIKLTSVKQLPELLPGNDAALKKYIRGNRIKIDGKHPGIIRDVVSFSSHLIQ